MKKLFIGKKYLKNKKGFTLLDVGIATIILSLLGTLMFTMLSAYYTSIVKTEESTYVNFALSECAEVVHSFRYGEIDRGGSGGWNNFQSQYPTSLYRLNYEDASRNWTAEPIWQNPDTKYPYDNFKQMLNTTGYTDYTEGEKISYGTHNNRVTRYVYINNDNPEKSLVTCFAKLETYMFRKYEDNTKPDYRLYNRLNFVMTDY